VSARVERSAAAALREAGMARGLLPVWLPVSALLPLDGTPGVLERLRADLLVAVRRRVRYRQAALTVEALGIAVAWSGVLWPAGSPVTLVGVALAAAGALPGLTGKDRLSSVDSRIGEIHRRQRAGLAEWLAMVLEIDPYSYGRTGASGSSKLAVLEARRLSVRSDVVEGLGDWLRSAGSGPGPGPAVADRWAELQGLLGELVTVDERGQRSRRRLETVVDRFYAGLLVALVVVAATSASAGLPSAALATVASLIVLGGRAADEVTVSALPGEPRDASGGGTEGTLRMRRTAGPGELTVADLDALAAGWALVPRSVRGAR